MTTDDNNKIIRKPSWLKIKLGKGENFSFVRRVIQEHNLHTICTSGQCPNQSECWNAGTATFMILGDICTRACKFCATKTGKPLPVDDNEPEQLAESIKLLKLKHCVITSVDRDDLPDAGATHWARCIRAIKQLNPSTTIETLIPDFDANKQLIEMVIDAAPDVISHNVETVSRLTPLIRSRAQYNKSLQVIETIAKAGVVSKSGVMVGIGETFEEIIQTMDDLRNVGCQIFTIGQYLQPTKKHLPVERYLTPDEFEELKKQGLKRGFSFVESAPLVRSSYHAEKHVKTK